MRVSLALTGVLVLLTAGCSGAERDPNEPHSSNSDSAASAPPATTANASAEQRSLAGPLEPSGRRRSDDVGSVPDVSPDAAPDLAFGYKYSFGLAADDVAPVQQRHARLCEELGSDRCRVVGMNYRRERDDGVVADLKLALEPGLAHRFGERALDSVRDADGELLDSLVTGTDVGTGIRASTRTIAQLEEQLAELEEQIARGGGVGTLRDLRAEAETLRQRIQSLRTERGDKREELATTPMSLSYTSDYVARGSAADWLISTMSALAPFIALIGLAGLAIWQSRRRRRELAPATAA